LLDDASKKRVFTSGLAQESRTDVVNYSKRFNSGDAMSTSSIASLSTAMATANTDQDVSMAVLKKSIDLASNGVAELLSSIPPAPEAVNLPSHLGQNVNTTA